MASAADVVIVGGGVFGVAGALELARRGAKVTLLEPGPLPHPDAASTDITKLIRLDYANDDHYTAAMEVALPLWRRWNAEIFEVPLFHETGVLVLSSTPLGPGSFEGDSFSALSARGHHLERLDAAGIVRRFPRWAAGRYVEGYYNPQGGFAESGRVVAALAAEARRAGVDLREGVRARPFEGDAAVSEVVLESGERVAAGTVVVAAGAFTPVLIPELADRLAVVGQPVFHFDPGDLAPFASPAFVPWAADIGRSGWYGFASHAGVVKVANHGVGTPLHPSGPRQVGEDAEPMFRAFLRESLPSLADARRVATRLCLYCDSFDGDFFIDRHPSRPGLVVAAGGSGHAFKFAPLLGGWLADAALDVARRDNARFRFRERGAAAREAARHAPIPARS